MPGCQKPDRTPVTTAVTSPAGAVPNAAGTSPARTTSVKQTVQRPTFDGERALAQLKKQCDFGPRPLGSEAHEKLRAYLLAEMKKYADKTLTQEFTYRDMPVTNIVGIFYPEGSQQPAAQPVLLMAHWDTRPIADGPYSSEVGKNPPFRYGPHGWNRTAPILGADDGASGVAVLLELARLFKQKRSPVGVLLLLDDGEDYGDFRANNGEGDGVILGARYFAKHFQETKEFGRPNYGILLDMVGAKGLILPREDFSQQYAPGTNDKVFGMAQALGYGNIFLANETQSVEDDHIPLNQAGIPTIDLIHPLPFGNYETTGYRFWHTLQDTPDKCSAKSLKAVGETVAEVLYRETPE
ncbi:MAG TPA: M28 family peptidase [Chthonomonadaceae bacterium]|nr:M28 family peptidase [Chthonomonadaceae bacterium]